MRGFVVSAALLGGLAVATADADKPTFSPTSIKAPFVEQFTEDWQARWTPSEATKKTAVGGETFAYVGVWSVEEPIVLPSIEGDKGLVAKSKAMHHAISAHLPEPVDAKGKTLVVQYEAKFQKKGNCGGGYLKLLEQDALVDKEFSDTTPWVIMFGPDMTCPGTKVHFIFRHKNPITGEIEEKHLATPPTPAIDEMTKLYTLIVHPNNTYNVLVDDELKSEGSLLENFKPAVNPEKEIDDPEDFKPEDWVDEARIPDPEATKPEDWDENEPFQIEDDEAEIPEGWLVDEPSEIADPEAEKPEEWDDEEDGDWIGPLVKNPKCEEAPGCGPWKRPTKLNPKYKGIWKAPLVDNPAYKGVWAPRKIANPGYFEDLHPADFRPIGAVGYEIWSMTEDIMFDNIYIGHSVDDAKALAAETFHVKHKLEQAAKDKEAEEKAATAKKDSEKAKTDGGFQAVLEQLKADPMGYIRDKVFDFAEEVQEDGLVNAFKANPEVGGTLLAAVLTLFGALAALTGLVGSSAQPVSKSTKKEPTVAKDGANKTPNDSPKVAASEPAAAAGKSTATSSETPVKKRK